MGQALSASPVSDFQNNRMRIVLLIPFTDEKQRALWEILCLIIQSDVKEKILISFCLKLLIIKYLTIAQLKKYV